MTRIGLALFLVLGACGDNLDGGGGGGGGPDAGPDVELPAASEDWTRDLLHTALELDLAARTGRATIDIAASDSTGASFEIGDLEITAVTDGGGVALHQEVTEGQLDVGVPATGDTATVVIEYGFQEHDATAFDGWMPTQGLTFLWPYFCGNLFPCKSDPADGQTFAMAVTGAEGVAIYPASIPAEAPTYMPAVAVGDFTEVELGTSSGGTALSVWHLPGEAADAAQGTAHLLEVFSFYEETYGAYTFGDTAGTVSANWGVGAYGGMEHHPYWHVANGALGSEEINAHEAAHGWYGNGVRIACWEDFVLSEGVVTYMAARALEQSGVDVWPQYECDLKRYTCRPAYNTIALPDTCNSIDILTDPLWSLVPYMKGAYFLRAVARRIGAAELDASLASFYQANVGKAAKMDELIAVIQADHPDDADAIGSLADRWLRQLECPINLANLCN